ncbi:MAG: hypothetical protein U0703_14105 [Anaerolineae bacterium]
MKLDRQPGGQRVVRWQKFFTCQTTSWIFPETFRLAMVCGSGL